MSNLYFPEDVLGDILSRLPVKSLLRFKCVSRSWRRMIESKAFIKMHANRSEATKSGTKLIVAGFSGHPVTCSKPRYNLYAVDFNLSPASSETNKAREISHPRTKLGTNYGITIVGSCNGVICLVYSERFTVIVLWNPTIRKQIKLPLCSDSPLVYDYCVHGFGYDEVRGDYKVVKLVKFPEHQLHQYASSGFFMFSLKSNKWRRLEDFDSYGSNLMWGNDGVLCNGALHWLLRDRSILAFSIGTEKFQLLSPPREASGFPGLASLCTQVPGGCLHLILEKFRPRFMEIWVMKSYGVQDSWTKLTLDFWINQQVWGWMPVGFLRSDKEIGLRTGNMKIWLYDLAGQAFKEVVFPVAVNKVKGCVFFESLVRLDNAGGEDEFVGMSFVKRNRRTGKRRRGFTSTEDNLKK